MNTVAAKLMALLNRFGIGWYVYESYTNPGRKPVILGPFMSRGHADPFPCVRQYNCYRHVMFRLTRPEITDIIS